MFWNVLMHRGKWIQFEIIVTTAELPTHSSGSTDCPNYRYNKKVVPTRYLIETNIKLKSADSNCRINDFISRHWCIYLIVVVVVGVYISPGRSFSCFPGSLSGNRGNRFMGRIPVLEDFGGRHLEFRSRT